MLTASVENMLVTSIDTTLETGVVPTQYIVIISTAHRQSDSDSRMLVFNVGSTLVRLLISAWAASIFEMLTASVANMLVTSIDTTLEIGVVPTQYIVIISTVRRQSEVGIQRWIDVGPIVNFCLGRCWIFSIKEKNTYFRLKSFQMKILGEMINIRIVYKKSISGFYQILKSICEYYWNNFDYNY